MKRTAIAVALALASLAGPPPALAAGGAIAKLPVRTLDGRDNNRRHPRWGRAKTRYPRVAPARYADGIGAMAAGPPPRYISNRIFNDEGQNLFSESDISQWGWAWGQFIDHDVGLRDETAGEPAPIAFDPGDPLERFGNDFGSIGFARTPAAPGTGTLPGSPRQQINTISSYIDASNVYGVSRSRLDWLRAGRRDGDPSDNSARLLLPGGYLPGAGTRGNVAGAPPMDLSGPLEGDPAGAAVAGDVRANENTALTSIQTVFAREHNRIVAALPAALPSDERFQIARRVVNAEEQYVTYHEFLPTMGVTLPPYRGYDPRADAGISNEFATVGFRAHSMVHGDFTVAADPGTYSPAQLSAFAAEGISTDEAFGHTILGIPLFVSFGNPGLLKQVGLGVFLRALGQEAEYRNDEQIDDSLRSVLFQVPKPGTADPACGLPAVNPDCFTGVEDLGAIDIQRGRDHGMPFYNEMRRAYGLAPKRSFMAITGEASQRFQSDPEINAADPIDDPSILDFVKLFDVNGNPIALGSNAALTSAVVGIRRTTLAARLKAIYGTVSRLDAFTGMMSEPHLPGSQLGQLQSAIWRTQFQALRDGDRFFYRNQPGLAMIRRRYGITFRHTLARIIELNTGVAVQRNVFKVRGTQ